MAPPSLAQQRIALPGIAPKVRLRCWVRGFLGTATVARDSVCASALCICPARGVSLRVLSGHLCGAATAQLCLCALRLSGAPHARGARQRGARWHCHINYTQFLLRGSFREWHGAAGLALRKWLGFR